MVERLTDMDVTEQKFSWPRLMAAILIAFVASMIWFTLYSEVFGFVGPYWANVLLGLTGVFAGTLCLRARYRFIGSVILLIGGVVFDGFFEDSDDKIYPLSVFWVAAGGLIVVTFYYVRRPNPQGGANAKAVQLRPKFDVGGDCLPSLTLNISRQNDPVVRMARAVHSLHQRGSGGGELFQLVGTNFGVLEVERIQHLGDRRGDDDAREPFVVGFYQIGRNSFPIIISLDTHVA
jgi:hypothetical protein